MAEKVIRVDDLDGSESDDVAKRDFDLVGRTFTLDLSEANHNRLQELLEELGKFLDNANEVKKAKGGSQRKSSDKLAGSHTTSDVREWAKNNGLEVNARGKIADEVYAQYYEAHPDAKPE